MDVIPLLTFIYARHDISKFFQTPLKCTTIKLTKSSSINRQNTRNFMESNQGKRNLSHKTNNANYSPGY
jgi:hypothetical protein